MSLGWPHDPRCQHDPRWKCDSRCNEGAASPWHLASGEAAHAWCLPQSYRNAGWMRGVDRSVHGDLVGVDCEFCNCPMTEFPA